MAKKLGLGCLGLLGVILVLGVVATLGSAGNRATAPTAASPPRTTASPPTAQPAAAPPLLGDTVARGNWEVTVLNYGPWEKFSPRAPSRPPQGKLVVAEFTAKNLHNQTSQFTTSDFLVQSGDGRRFQPTSQTIENGFLITERVQPGLAATKRVVFDVDPAATNLRLTILGVTFPLPD